MKFLIVGIWVVIVALGSAYGAAVYMPGGTGAKAVAAAPVLQVQKTRVLNVPMITGGTVRGFITVQLAYTIDGDTLKGLHVSPEVYLLDETFRTLYADGSLDPHKLDKYDLHILTAKLKDGTNAHLGAPLIKDVLIEQFSYVSRDTMDK